MITAFLIKTYSYINYCPTVIVVTRQSGLILLTCHWHIVAETDICELKQFSKKKTAIVEYSNTFCCWSPSAHLNRLLYWANNTAKSLNPFCQDFCQNLVWSFSCALPFARLWVWVGVVHGDAAAFFQSTLTGRHTILPWTECVLTRNKTWSRSHVTEDFKERAQ